MTVPGHDLRPDRLHRCAPSPRGSTQHHAKVEGVVAPAGIYEVELADLPLSVSKKEVDAGLQIISEAIAIADEYCD